MVPANSCALEGVAHVRFGSKADTCSAKRHVRFTPESDIKCDGIAANFQAAYRLASIASTE